MDLVLIIKHTFQPCMQSFTIKLILVFNVGAFALMMVTVSFFVKGPNRVTAVGCVCAVYNVAVFFAPLSIMVTINS